MYKGVAPIAIYLFEEVRDSNTDALKLNGFNTVLIFRISVLPNGDLKYICSSKEHQSAETLVCRSGEYVGGEELARKVTSYKIAPTTINRIEISMVSDNSTFESIKNRISEYGTGSDTELYKNFEALKEAWNIDAVNDDDEVLYDTKSTVSFAKMIGTMGLQFTLCPYNRVEFWKGVRDRLDAEAPGLVDRVYLQCYDNGIENNPGIWQENMGMKVIPVLWVANDCKPEQGKLPEQVRETFLEWNNKFELAGGGLWNEYDIDKMKYSYTEYGNALKSVFG